MTRALAADEVADLVSATVPRAVEDRSLTAIWVAPSDLVTVTRILRDSTQLDMSFLTSLTAVDYIEYFELVYRLVSLRRNHSIVVKCRLYEREDPVAPSVSHLWRGAELQEREVWDLMGIRFEGHPNMKRILLWEGFEGHPLRKSFLR